MLRKNRIFVISKDTDGIEVVYASKIIPRNFQSNDYFGIIKDVFSHNQVGDEGYKIKIKDKIVEFDKYKDLDDFVLNISLENIYDNIYIINQLNKFININVEPGSMFDDAIVEDGMTITPDGILVLCLNKKIRKSKNPTTGNIIYEKDKADIFDDLEYFITIIDKLRGDTSMEDKYKEKLNSVNEEERKAAEEYFSKRNAIDSLFSVVRSKFTLKEPFGNFNSKVICVLDFDKLDDKIIKLIKKFYEINSSDFYDIYITPYHKTNNDKINDKLLEKEISFIKPDRVISLGIDNLNLGSESMTMNKSDYDYFYNCVGNKDLISGDEYKQKKQIFTDIMKFIITGERG